MKESLVILHIENISVAEDQRGRTWHGLVTWGQAKGVTFPHFSSEGTFQQPDLQSLESSEDQRLTSLYSKHLVHSVLWDTDTYRHLFVHLLYITG